jgi:hypothetical protein
MDEDFEHGRGRIGGIDGPVPLPQELKRSLEA